MNRAARVCCGCVLAVMLVSLFVAKHAHADDWLPIPPEDLALKDNPASPGADAMILYRENTVNAKNADYDGDSDEEYMRIKIFTQAGVQRGDIEIPFDRDQQDVKDIRGRTIHPDGSIVNFDGKVLEREIIRRSGLRVLAKTFSLPDVQAGSIIEYHYRLQGKPGWLHNESWTVSSDLFTREAQFTYIPYDRYFGFLPYVRAAGLPASANPQCKPDGKCTMDVHDIPPVVDEALMPPEGFLEARVEFLYKNTNEPHGETPAAYWTRVSKKWNSDLDHFIDKKNALRADLAQVVAPSDSPEAKLRKIYARAEKIRNLSLEETRTQQVQKQEDLKRNGNVADVLSNGYGTGRDINFLFVGLAREAGFDATDVYVAPRNDHLFSPEAENADDLGADVVWVKAGDKEYYLDPGSKYFPFGVLPWYETEVDGLRITKQGGVAVSIPRPANSDAKIVRAADLTMNGIGEVTGTIQTDFTGQEGALRREKMRQDDELGRKKSLEDEIKSWLPGNATFEVTTVANWDNTEQPLHVEGTLKLPGFAGSAGRRVLVPLEIFRDPQYRSFEPQKRVNNIYFRYPYEVIDDLKLRILPGYKVSSLPTIPKVDRGAVSYELSVAHQENIAEIKRHLVVNGTAFSKDLYPALRAFFSVVRTDDDAQMVLQGNDSAKN
ncbi:MAG: DUF3857 domain-containing protein [Candidatus Acidiferrales bacterium]